MQPHGRSEPFRKVTAGPRDSISCGRQPAQRAIADSSSTLSIDVAEALEGSEPDRVDVPQVQPDRVKTITSGIASHVVRFMLVSWIFPVVSGCR